MPPRGIRIAARAATKGAQFSRVQVVTATRTVRTRAALMNVEVVNEDTRTVTSLPWCLILQAIAPDIKQGDTLLDLDEGVQYEVTTPLDNGGGHWKCYLRDVQRRPVAG